MQYSMKYNGKYAIDRRKWYDIIDEEDSERLCLLMESELQLYKNFTGAEMINRTAKALLEIFTFSTVKMFCIYVQDIKLFFNNNSKLTRIVANRDRTKLNSIRYKIRLRNEKGI